MPTFFIDKVPRSMSWVFVWLYVVCADEKFLDFVRRCAVVSVLERQKKAPVGG